MRVPLSSYAKEINPAKLREKWRVHAYDTHMTDIKVKEQPFFINLTFACTILEVNAHKELVHFQKVEEFYILHSRYMRFALSYTLESCSS